jgi:phosphoesterase RecJ-like protein
MSAPFETLDRFLSRHDRYIISTHESPDIDGLGAEIGFHEILLNLGKKPYILNSDPTPQKYNFIDLDGEIHLYTGEESLPPDVSDRAVFVLDTNDFDNIGGAYPHLKGRIRDVFIIDHHEGGKDKLESNLIKVEASSASEIIYELFRYYGFTPSFKAAQALYAGTLFDTGSFRYPKTSPGTFRMAAYLVELGANPFKIYEQIYERNSLNNFTLRAMILSSMEVHFGGKLIIMKLTPEMVRKSGASFAEGELSINLPLTVEGVTASVLVKQDIDGPVKVSMRTKGDHDVASIAIANGGGGHKNAAGYKSKVSFDETCEKVIREIGGFFSSSQ